MSPKREPPNQQAEKFKQLARELECDDDEKSFEDKVKKVATAPKALTPPSGKKA
jgi:hypothetical protein